MTNTLKTIPPDATRLIQACFGYDLMFGDNAELFIESLWKTTDGTYLIDCGHIVLEPETFGLIEWFNAVLNLPRHYYACHPSVDMLQLKEEFIDSRLPQLLE